MHGGEEPKAGRDGDSRIAILPAFIENGDFEQGLRGWRVVSGTAFAKQPVLASTIGAKDVMIDGRPLVPLGGNFWHTPYEIGQNGASLIRLVATGTGSLDSVPFTISDRYLNFRIGGSAGGGAALQLRVPAATARTLKLKALDTPDTEGYVAVKIALPSGSDVLRQVSLDLVGKTTPKGLIGAAAKVRLRVAGTKKRPQRLLVDYIRVEKGRPPAFHPPLWGWADIHCHPTAQAGFGDVMAGHMHGPVEDLGSCLTIHGHEHSNIVHPLSLKLDHGVHNDGSLAVSGWTTGTPGVDDELGFRGWPAFDEVTHIKTHQDWIRRAYDGGQRLMVALVVHNEMLALLSTITSGATSAQSDRDTVEPQVQMMHEFVAHNSDWCGLAMKPEEARALIEQNKMAFVLGLETDSINGWVKFTDFPDGPTADTVFIHDKIHKYFKYLHDLGIVQVNLLHLSDNAFGGMALYELLFMVNTWQRTGRFPDVDDGFTGRAANEVISRQVTLESELWSMVGPELSKIGINPPLPKNVLPFPKGHRNLKGLTAAGKVALLEAMRLGMVIDIDHMSEFSVDDAFKIASNVPGGPYPLSAAHNGARALSPRALESTAPAQADHRRNPETWPSESMKSETQLGYIKTTKGMFGQGIAGSDSLGFGAVTNDCPGTSKTVAQGLQYITAKLEMPVALGTDWNALLTGPGPRFGPRSAHGLEGEYKASDPSQHLSVAGERLGDALAQDRGVLYDTPIRDWRTYRFDKPEVYLDTSLEGVGHFIWQALALREAGANLTATKVVAALQDPVTLEGPALALARALTKMPMTLPTTPNSLTAHFFRAGEVVDKKLDPTMEPVPVQQLVEGIGLVQDLWTKMRSGTAPKMRRSTAGPVRDFDYNLDGLSHYGLLPDMLQDMKNVDLPDDVLTQFFKSAGRYVEVWEHSVKVALGIPH